MSNLITRYKTLSFEEKTIFNARFSIVFNFLLAIGKFILGFIANAVFFVTATINIFMMLSRLECYLGAVRPHLKTFRFRNNLVGTFLVLAGIIYTIYMILLLFSKFETRQYGKVVGIFIALVSFIELGVAIKGCFLAYGKGHYYRNIKMTNLCSAFTAIALTEMAIMSFAGDGQSKAMDCWLGIGVGILIFLLGVYVFIAPKVSIIDRRHNVYEMTEDSDLVIEQQINIQLTNSRFYGNYYFFGNIQGGVVDGMIFEKTNPLYDWNIFLKIIIIILSEILIFPYALGALIFYFKNANLIKKLDKIMIAHGCIKKIEMEAEEYGQDFIC